MRVAGTRPAQRVDLSHFLLTFAAPSADYETLSAELWARGAVGVEELDAGLRAAFTDHAMATSAREGIGRGGSIEEFDDSFGLDAARDLLEVEIAGRFAIHPPWLTPPTGLIGIEIDPGHAFGSGSHPSTRLALQLLGHETPRRVFDIGCGTGVLSIGAAHLGATVTAVDTDPAAIEATTDNAARNGVGAQITAQLGSSAHVVEACDLVLINVTIDVHEALAPALSPAHHRLIVAGILGEGQLDRCAAAYRAVVVDQRDHEGWMAAVLTRS